MKTATTCLGLTSLLLWSVSGLCDEYDLCKDILRDGVRDTLSSTQSSHRQMSNHMQFCNMAKEHNLSTNTFDTFAQDYAKKAHVHQSGGGGSAKVSVFGLLDVEAGGGGGYTTQDFSESARVNLLKKNKSALLDYSQNHCGEQDYSDNLRAEATTLASIANPEVVRAWSDCMSQQSGLFVQLVPPSSISSQATEADYSLLLKWKSNEGTSINRVKLRYKDNLVATPYQEVQENSNYRSTLNLCDAEGFCLAHGSQYTLSVTQKNLSSNAQVVVSARTNTGVEKSHVAVLPSRKVPDLILAQLPLIEGRFLQQEDGHYLDTRTGLVWNKNHERIPHLLSDDGHEKAIAACNALEPQGSWRLPTDEEFESIKRSPSEQETTEASVLERMKLLEEESNSHNLTPERRGELIGQMCLLTGEIIYALPNTIGIFAIYETTSRGGNVVRCVHR